MAAPATVVDMGDSDYGSGVKERPKSSEGDQSSDMTKHIQSNVTAYLVEAGKQQAKKAFSIYGNLDILRPYFDVEPNVVRSRLLGSFVPQKPGPQHVSVPRELYGPLMTILTLVAILLYQMKAADHSVQEGTLMGSALVVCFGYWIGGGSLLWSLAYVSSTRISLVQILSMTGYGLSGHCVVLLMGSLLHTSHDHLLFYILWAVVGGLCALRMAGVLVSRTSGKSQRLVMSCTAAGLHLLFLLYLHFAYHAIVTELSASLGGGQQHIVKQVAFGGAPVSPGQMAQELASVKAPVVAKVTLKPIPSNLGAGGQ